MSGLIEKDKVRNSFREKAALAQLHRWNAFCADKDAPIERIADLINEECQLLRGDEIAARGMKEILDHARQSDSTTGFALDVEVVGDLSADFKVQATGLSQTVSFSFDWQDHLQPKLRSIAYSDVTSKAVNTEILEPIASRLLSVNHRWHVLVEDPNRSPKPFKEIISSGFIMDYGHGAVRSYDELVAWVNGSASSVGASRHDMASFNSEQLEDDLYKAVFLLDWTGLTHEDKYMRAQTEHIWTIRDVSANRYPLIEHIKVNFLQPFKVIE